MFVGLLADFVGDHAAVDAAVVGDLLERSVEHAERRSRRRSARRPWRLTRAFSTASRATQQGHAAAGQDAFFDRRTGGVQGVFDAGLLLLHVGFGRGADRDDRHAAGQLRQPLLELLAVVLALGALRSALRICSIRFWTSAVLAGALDDRGVVLVDRDLLGPAELVERRRSRA